MTKYEFLVSTEGDPKQDPTSGRFGGDYVEAYDWLIDEHAEMVAIEYLEDRGVTEDTEVFVFCETTGEHYRFDARVEVRREYGLSRQCGYPSKDPEGT